jgi:hypothetical protein
MELNWIELNWQSFNSPFSTNLEHVNLSLKSSTVENQVMGTHNKTRRRSFNNNTDKIIFMYFSLILLGSIIYIYVNVSIEIMFLRI